MPVNKSKRKGAKSGKMVKKGVLAKSSKYITRTKAIRKLQISLKDFRRLCILKGVYPSDPKLANSKNGKDKTYYHVKDIVFLQHEPLLAKFREFKTFLKKYTRAIGRSEKDIAEDLVARRPTYKLDHLVKERYPSFVDALRDLDDSLCMIFLFSALPTKVISHFTPERLEMCERLSREFNSYVYHTKSLRKVFVSIKGVYYEAEIQGQPVCWLVPHKFTQYIPDDVDYRVMITFLEFYESLIRFVNFKLYKDLNLKYPPVIDKFNDAKGEALDRILKIESTISHKSMVTSASAIVSHTSASSALSKKATKALQQQVTQVVNSLAHEPVEKSSKTKTSKNTSTKSASLTIQSQSSRTEGTEEEIVLDDFGALDPSSVSNQNQLESEKYGLTFKNKVFLLSREVPVDILEFVILCGGGVCVRETDLLEQAAGKVKLQVITHQIVDRPQLIGEPVAAREYVQPQWVFDSFNMKTCLPVSAYAIGAKLPPHLSPFVDDVKAGYIPEQRHVLRKWAGLEPLSSESAANGEGDDEMQSEVDEEEEYARGLAQERQGKLFSKTSNADSDNEEHHDDDDDEEDHDEEDDDVEGEEEDEDGSDSDSAPSNTIKQVEKKHRVPRNVKTAAPVQPSAIKKNSKAGDEEKESAATEKELAKIMMTNKHKNLMSRIEFGQNRKAEVNNKLMQKRKLNAEASEKQEASGSSTSKRAKLISASKKK
jgi:pescadillo protein